MAASQERYIEGVLHAGRNLAAKDHEVYGESSEPYAIVWVGGADVAEGEGRAMSEVVFESLSPKWECAFAFRADSSADLRVRVMDFDANKAHDYMGV